MLQYLLQISCLFSDPKNDDEFSVASDSIQTKAGKYFLAPVKLVKTAGGGQICPPAATGEAVENSRHTVGKLHTRIFHVDDSRKNSALLFYKEQGEHNEQVLC